MADTVNTQILANGPVNLIVKFTNFSDGTGESAVTKLDATSVSNGYKGVAPGVYLKLKRIQYDVRNMGLNILWDATADEVMLAIGQSSEDIKFNPPLRVPVGLVGATGSVNFTTLGAMPNSTYSVVMHFLKGVPQS